MKNIKTTSHVLLCATAILNWSCGGDRKYEGSIDSSEVVEPANQDASSENVSKGGPSDQEDLLGANIGILNFRQVSSTFSELTGVSLTGDTLLEYEEQFAAFNKRNDVRTISPSTVSAVTKLAAAYCDALLASPDLFSAKFPTMDLSAASIESPEEFSELLLDQFYGPVSILQGERSKDVGLLTEYVVDLTSQNIATADVVFGACTSVLASAEFYLF